MGDVGWQAHVYETFWQALLENLLAHKGTAKLCFVWGDARASLKCGKLVSFTVLGVHGLRGGGGVLKLAEVGSDCVRPPCCKFNRYGAPSQTFLSVLCKVHSSVSHTHNLALFTLMYNGDV